MKLNLVAAPSSNFEDRKDSVQFIIIHATGTKTVQETLDVLEKRQVSAHYVIDYDGTIYGLVDPDKRAWHAGVSDWQGYCKKTGFRSAFRSDYFWTATDYSSTDSCDAFIVYLGNGYVLNDRRYDDQSALCE